MKLRLFPKIAFVLIALATVPVVLVGWQTYSLNKEYLATNILELHTNLANSLSSRINRYLTGEVEKTRAFIEALRMQGVISAVPLQALVDSNEEFISIAYADLRGRELLKAVRKGFLDEKELKDRSAASAFEEYRAQVLAESSPVAPAFGFYFEKEDPRLAIVFPVDANNPGRGLFYAVVSLADFWNVIAREGAGLGGGGREAFVTDARGTVIAHSSRPELATKQVSFSGLPIVASALQRHSAGSQEFRDADGNEMVGSYSEVPLTRWIAVVQQSKKSAYYPIFETRKNAVRIVIVSILIAAIAAFLLAKGILRPVFALIEGARRIARGDFGHYVEVRTGDELNDLARTFNEMVTELRRYNALQVDQIINEKTKTEAVIFSIADGIILTGQDGEIQLVNDQAIEIFSLDPDRLRDSGSFVGRNLNDLIRDPKIKDAFREILENRSQPVVKDIQIPAHPLPKHFQLSSKMVHVRGTDRKLGMVAIVHDVTMERQMDEMKENFLHSITHDLRNPATSIVGFIKFLLDGTAGTLTEQQTQMVRTMDRASTRLLRMINDILDIAKVEAGKLDLEIEKFNLLAVLEEAAAFHRPLLERKSIRFETVLPEGAAPGSLFISGNANQIERVIGNLVGNAIKFTPFEGRIVLAVEDLPERIQVSVSDSGPGVPEDYRERVFNKFQQVDGQKMGGTGLGLTICKYFVELHKGKIWVEAAESDGKGSRFVFWIPKNLKEILAG